MLKAIDVANFFIYLLSDKEDEENDLTNMKLNKLTYYAQGQFLKTNGKPLFSEGVEAWRHGPVVPSVYYAFKENKNNPIKNFSGDFDISKYTDEEKEVMLDVAFDKGRYSAITLRNMTHKPGGPWAQSYNGSLFATISNDLIKEYFCKHDILEPLELDLSDCEVIGHRDNDGYLVLPKEYDC